MNRALRVAWPALTIVVALVTSIAVTVSVSGGSSALLVVRAAALVLLALAIATVLGAALAAALEPDGTARGRLLDLGAGGAAAWTVVSAACAFLLYLGQAPALDSPDFGPGLVTFVFDLEVGRAWLIAAALAAVLTALLIGVRSRRGTLLLAAAVIVSAAPIALQSAMSGDPLDVERSVVTASLVQLVALGTWIGAVALRPARVASVSAFGAAAVGVGACWAALIADGAVTAVAMAGGVAVVLAGVAAVVSAVVRTDLRRPQLLLLGLGIGLGVAASVTRTAPDVPARTTPAEILTGAPLPQAPSIGALVGSWRPDAVWSVVAVALVVGHLVAARRAGPRPPAWRTVCWIAGAVLLVWLTSGGPAQYAQVLVAASLVQHVALLLVVPVLLAAGAPLRLLAAALPSLRLPSAVGVLVRPLPAMVLVVAVMGLLLGTGLLRWSLTDPIGTETVIGLCLLAGLMLARAIGAPGARRRSAVVVAIVLLVLEAAAAVLLGSGSGLLVADWYGAMGWGTDALAAQQGAAALVWPVAAVPTVVLLVAALRSSSATSATSLARPTAVTA